MKMATLDIADVTSYFFFGNPPTKPHQNGLYKNEVAYLATNKLG
jgi:hypothetical protein